MAAQTSGFNNAFTSFATIAIDPTNSSNVYTGSFGDSDGFLLKLNPAGAERSTVHTLGAIAAITPLASRSTRQHNVYLSGFARAGFPTTAGHFKLR